MAYVRCDVASNGPYEYRFTGQWFPRCDVNPTGSWVAADCDESGSRVYVKTSAGERHDLGPRHPDNPVCVRWVPGRSVFKVAWVDNVAQGRSVDFDGHGFRIPGSEGTFDASGAGSQGIRDMDELGTISFKDATDAREVDGLVLLHWRERDDFIVGVLQHTWIGVSVFDTFHHCWYRAFPHDVQLLPGIAHNGTVAVTGEGGGFIEMTDWLKTPFDPHVVPLPPVESVPLLQRTFGGGCFTFNDDPGLGNLTLPIRPVAAALPEQLVIASGDYHHHAWFETIDPATVWGVYAGAAEGFPIDQAVWLGREVAAPFQRGLVIYQDSWPLTAETLSYVTEDDLALVLLIREAGESREQFKARAATLPPGAWVSLNLKDDAAQAVETFIAAAEVARDQGWVGWFVFAAGRSDVAWTTLAPYLERFLSGITGVPPALTLDPPDPSEPTDLPSADEGIAMIEAVIADLTARGISMAGDCGAYAITERVAWAYRDRGGGLEIKTTGRNCEGYSQDILFWDDGTSVDILVGAGVENTPSWQVHPPFPGWEATWAPPHDPDDTTDPPDPTYPMEPDMTRNVVFVKKCWHEVEEMAHPDAGAEHGPVVGVKRVSDGWMLKVRGDGTVEFETGSPGADERLIPVPGAYVALRAEIVTVRKAGPWTA